jgi:hypothetical protein
MTSNGPVSGVVDLIRSTARTTSIIDLVQQPVNILLGVNDAANTTLQKLGIVSIFDLATSAIFDSATKVVSASDPTSLLYRYGKAPADLVRASRSAGKPVQELQNEPIALLSSIQEADASSIAAALNTQTVYDLAFSPPYRAALKILQIVYFPQSGVTSDPEYPDDLVPKTGEYPTEKVQYSTLHMGEIKNPDGTQLIDVSSSNFTPLDLSGLVAASRTGFKTVATGALLTFSQS